MIYTVDLLPKAHREIFEGWKWYEEEQPGLGNLFEAEVFSKIDLIADNPLHYPLKGKAYHANTDKFPYVILYKINKKRNVVMIVSVFHTSRHPRKKYRL